MLYTNGGQYFGPVGSKSAALVGFAVRVHSSAVLPQVEGADAHKNVD